MKCKVLFLIGATCLMLGDLSSEVVYEEPRAALPPVQHAPDIPRTGAYFVDENSPALRAEELREDTFNVPEKRQAAKALVDRAAAYLASNSIDAAFSEFTHGAQFIAGELYIFVLDGKGTMLAHGDDPSLVWQDMINARDDFGTYWVKDALALAQQGEGWLTYQWKHATQVTFIKKVIKDGQIYVIGCGYFPFSKRDEVVSLVKGAVAHFNNVVKGGHRPEEAFSSFSYPLGKFVMGDLYLYALDFNGRIMAQGERPGLVGTAAWDVRDSAGIYANQEIIKKLKEANTGVWVEYLSKNAVKRSYAEKVKDAKGKEYFIACGYYPTADREHVIDLVRKGYVYMKKGGKQAAADFTDVRNNDFRFGDLYLYVYNMNGICVAHGRNNEYVGVNQMNEQDDDGKYYVRELIEKAKRGGGWIDFKKNNMFVNAYVEKIDLGVESYVIGSALYPISKKESMELLVKTAASYLKSRSREEAFREFVKRNGNFIRGDLFVYVVDFQGICFAYGDNHILLWQNVLGIKDDKGRPFVQMGINSLKQGSTNVSYYQNGALRTDYVERVDKDGKSYIVGSGFTQ